MFYVMRDGEDDDEYFEIGQCTIEEVLPNHVIKCSYHRGAFLIDDHCVFASRDAATEFAKSLNENLPIHFA